MRWKLKCEFCEKSFYNEMTRNGHILFDHGFAMPVCSTGIETQKHKENVELLKKYKNYLIDMSRAKSALKKRFLKTLYGRRTDMKSEMQNNVWLENLGKYHSGEFTRLKYVDTTLYDAYFKIIIKTLKEINTRGIVLG